MAVRKGSLLHRASGNVFTVAMLTLASSGFFLAILKSQRGNIIGSIITSYLITTAWLVGRRGVTGLLEWLALLGVQTLSHTDKNAPAAMCFFFAVVLLLAGAGDIRVLARGGISGRLRITRHLWRMRFGLFIAQALSSSGSNKSFPLYCGAPSS